MSNRQEIEMVRASAMDALCTLHYKMCERSLSVQQIAEVAAWNAIHEAACRELSDLPEPGPNGNAALIVAQCIALMEQRFSISQGIDTFAGGVVPLLRQALTELEG